MSIHVDLQAHSNSNLVTIEGRVFSDRRLSAPARLLFAYLCAQDGQPTSFMSAAEALSLHVAQARSAFEELTRWSYLFKHEGSGGHVYRTDMPARPTLIDVTDPDQVREAVGAHFDRFVGNSEAV